MRRFYYRLRPWADRKTRQAAVLEIRRLIESGCYHVPAERVADALLSDEGFGKPEHSSCGGPDADAK